MCVDCNGLVFSPPLLLFSIISRCSSFFVCFSLFQCFCLVPFPSSPEASVPVFVSSMHLCLSLNPLFFYHHLPVPHSRSFCIPTTSFLLVFYPFLGRYVNYFLLRLSFVRYCTCLLLVFFLLSSLLRSRQEPFVSFYRIFNTSHTEPRLLMSPTFHRYTSNDNSNSVLSPRSLVWSSNAIHLSLSPNSALVCEESPVKERIVVVV